MLLSFDKGTALVARIAEDVLGVGIDVSILSDITDRGVVINVMILVLSTAGIVMLTDMVGIVITVTDTLVISEASAVRVEVGVTGVVASVVVVVVMVKLSVCICFSGDRVAVRVVCETNYNTLLFGIVEDTIEGTVVDGVM